VKVTNISRLLLFSIFTLLQIKPVIAASEPTTANTCANTFVSYVGSRLEGVSAREAGSAITFTNRLYSDSYNYQEYGGSKKGDEVTLCLLSIPKNCPRGDDRGKVFSVTNRRTELSFTISKGHHLCGGA